MLYIVHHELDEFLAIASVKRLPIFSRVYALDNGIAGLVYMCKDDTYLYYYDRIFSTSEKNEEISQLDMYELHKELYEKINLDITFREN